MTYTIKQYNKDKRLFNLSGKPILPEIDLPNWLKYKR